jgi:hypothetical protein
MALSQGQQPIQCGSTKENLMRRFHITTFLAFATFLLVSICSAQQAATTAVPNLIRYSGTLKDAQGAALASPATVGVTFAIYKQQDGGAAVWMETQNVTPDASGQYSVLLGSTTATGLPDDLFSQQEQRWLGVQAQGQAEQPRVLLVSVPYALKAHEAETLGGLPASAFVKAPPASEVGSTSVEKDASVNPLRAASGIGSLSGSPLLSTPVSNSPCPAGTVPAPNFVPLWFIPTVSSTVICNSVIFQTPIGAAGNVGIGTTTPSAKLEVNGDINLADMSQAYQIGGYSVLSASNLNVFVGDLTGGNGNYNVALGHGAGEVDGQFNVSVGNQSNQGGEGDDNTLVGANTGMIGVFGNANTWLGSGAGFNATYSSHDIFIGYHTGTQGAFSTTSTSTQTALGAHATPITRRTTLPASEPSRQMRTSRVLQMGQTLARPKWCAYPRTAI